MEEKGIFFHLQIKNIDVDILTSLYFWDTDFLIPKDHFDMIPLDAKERLGFSQETFGVVHSLKPHPGELELEIMEIPANWSWRKEEIFKQGEDYPFIE